ncbi:MAG: hypothetical protein COB36_14015 [Alphaproteobacteria bacterium]|nr:MAG: hypothetical protein COB36_14015 [Alphaproteobacteria bacterium]
MSNKNVEAVCETINTAQPVEETIEQVVERLARLAPLEYDLKREGEAQKLGVRVTALDKEIANHRRSKITVQDDSALFPHVEPWRDPVDAAELFDDIQSMVRYYIICNTETAIATTLWIAFTWFVDQVQVAPIAMITAPEKRCGKSQLLTLISKLVSRPLLASNISPAAIFRVIEAHSPTLLIDEADTFLRDNEEARGIINSGHTRSTAHVIRVVGDEHEAKQFSTWGAKVICGIGKQAETLMDRSVMLELRRKMPNESVQRLRHAEPLQFDILKRHLARLSVDAAYVIGEARPELPEELNDRAQDNWEPLLAIADYAGGHWPKTARQAALTISGKEHDAASLSTELLQDIKDVFEEHRVLKVKTRDLIDYLCEDDMRPWATYNRGKPFTPRQLAKRLSEYGIEPKVIRIGTMTPRGFDVGQFEDAFSRYIPSDTPLISATPQHNPCNKESQDDTAVADMKSSNATLHIKAQQTEDNVADNPQRCTKENHAATPNTAVDNVCCTVADTAGVSPDVEVF